MQPPRKCDLSYNDRLTPFILSFFSEEVNDFEECFRLTFSRNCAIMGNAISFFQNRIQFYSIAV